MRCVRLYWVYVRLLSSNKITKTMKSRFIFLRFGWHWTVSYLIASHIPSIYSTKKSIYCVFRANVLSQTSPQKPKHQIELFAKMSNAKKMRIVDSLKSTLLMINRWSIMWLLFRIFSLEKMATKNANTLLLLFLPIYVILTATPANCVDFNISSCVSRPTHGKINSRKDMAQHVYHR